MQNNYFCATGAAAKPPPLLCTTAEVILGPLNLPMNLPEPALVSWSTLVKETGCEVVTIPLPELPISATHLSQLIRNLVGNAIKYRRSEVPPRVRIEARRQGEEMLVSVADNGQGIPVEYRERVFGLFKRLHSSEMPGTGLGLAICKRIIEHYGGRIWIGDGEDGAGTTFWIALPMA